MLVVAIFLCARTLIGKKSVRKGNLCILQNFLAQSFQFFAPLFRIQRGQTTGKLSGLLVTLGASNKAGRMQYQKGHDRIQWRVGIGFTTQTLGWWLVGLVRRLVVHDWILLVAQFPQIVQDPNFGHVPQGLFGKAGIFKRLEDFLDGRLGPGHGGCFPHVPRWTFQPIAYRGERR